MWACRDDTGYLTKDDILSHGQPRSAHEAEPTKVGARAMIQPDPMPRPVRVGALPARSPPPMGAVFADRLVW